MASGRSGIVFSGRRSLGRLAAGLAFLGMITPQGISAREDAERVVAVPAQLCRTQSVMVDFNIPSAGMHTCQTAADGWIDISVSPEDDPPINCSAWYAFRVTPLGSGPAKVRLRYEACGHRYVPKVSTDFVSWKPLDPASVSLIDADGDGRSEAAEIEFDPRQNPTYIAAQEVIPVGTYDQWIMRLEAHPFVEKINIGESVEGRPIEGVLIGNPDAEKLVVLIGRQHPPEVTGALALFPFAETLVSDHPLAVEYRQNVLTLLVPLVNPDGVARGHWRHNTQGTDLNRDWGPFAQAETRAVRDTIAELVETKGKKLQLLLDFHSTGKDVFYTLPEELVTAPADFTPRWLDRLEERLPAFTVNRDPGHNPDTPVSKAWAFETYGVPAVTFELGDETDRELIVRAGQESALAMMETLLAED